MHASFRPTAAAALALLGCAACVEIAAPTLGGDYRAVLDTPFSTEGAALVELHGDAIRAVSAPDRVLAAAATSDTSVRVLVMNNPRSFNGAPISFIVTVDAGQRAPSAGVHSVASPVNGLRDFPGAYGMNFTRASAAPSAQRAPGDAAAQEEPPYTFAELAAPFLGGAPLAPEVQAELDDAGNVNGVYDIGDLRAYLFAEPEAIPAPSSWTR